jgi:hypothetical protein
LADEIDQPFDVLLRGHGVAFHRHGDVVDRQHEMVFRRDVARPLNPVGQPQQSDDMARPGLIDRGVKAREGTDVDHGGNG